ncbi:MAG: hypothetical protein ACREOZ_02125 [Gloeomargaritales cyanobacterium]
MGYREDIEAEKTKLQELLHSDVGTDAEKTNARQDLVEANRIITRSDQQER